MEADFDIARELRPGVRFNDLHAALKTVIGLHERATESPRTDPGSIVSVRRVSRGYQVMTDRLGIWFIMPEGEGTTLEVSYSTKYFSRRRQGKD